MDSSQVVKEGPARFEKAAAALDSFRRWKLKPLSLGMVSWFRKYLEILELDILDYTAPESEGSVV